jgi:hypothetical protein
VTEAWHGDLYVLASPRSPTRFAKVVGASPTLLYLHAYSAPPALRGLETGVPDLLVEAQPADEDVRIVEASREEFETWGPYLRAKSGVSWDESQALNRFLLPSVPVISEELFRQLLEVEPSRDGEMEYRPCRVHLKDGRTLDGVYIADAAKYVALWGIWPEFDSHKRSVSVDDVVKIEESPIRIPAHLANKMYEAGESAMGGCFFTLVLDDGRRVPCATGNAVDFLELPADVTPGMMVDLLPHEGREAREPVRGADYFWCLYRPPDR